MGLLKGLGWTTLFFLAAIVGNSEVLLDHIPVWVCAGLFMSPFIYIALLAARSRI